MYKKRRNGGLQRISFLALTTNKHSQRSNKETQQAKAALLSSSPLLNGILKASASTQHDGRTRSHDEHGTNA